MSYSTRCGGMGKKAKARIPQGLLFLLKGHILVFRRILKSWRIPLMIPQEGDIGELAVR